VRSSIVEFQVYLEDFMRITTAAGIVCISLVSACTTANIQEDQRTLASARPCCSSLKDLPVAQRLDRDQSVVFSHASPHFDFGFGLAPFAAFAVDPSKVPGTIEVLSAPQPSRTATGGDGSVHYADTRVIFFGEEMSRLAADAEPSTSARPYGFLGAYHTTRTFVVPQGTRTIVVTTNAQGIAERGVQAYGEGHRTIPVAGVSITRSIGTVTGNTTSTPYGEIAIVAK
jgi:hypothetical protein